jgi:enterobacteria phage integrase
MSPARRSHRKRDWPRGLYEPRAGYYVWRHPDGRTLPIGRVSLATARNEALAANLHVQETKPGLVERLTGAGNTINDLLGKMPLATSPNTAKTRRSLDKKIARHLGTTQCSSLTVAACASAIETEAAESGARTAEAFRSRLISVCRKGMALGWMETNPASSTEPPDVEVQRGRLTLDSFRAIYDKAPEVCEWLQQAMRLALVTGADRSTIAGLQRADVSSGYLTFTRIKTGARVAVPLALRLDCMDWTLADVVAHRTNVLSKYLVHHVSPWGNAPAGSKVHPDRISHAFTEARKLAKIPDEGAPTFHEIRSLCKRLYAEQGNVDTKALLGHATERMSDLYADPRGVEPIKVRVN